MNSRIGTLPTPNSSLSEIRVGSRELVAKESPVSKERGWLCRETSRVLLQTCAGTSSVVNTKMIKVVLLAEVPDAFAAHELKGGLAG